MSSVDKVCFNMLMKTYKKGIRIPEIQRDYVMGANRDKLTALLDGICKACSDNKPFDFSCIITFCNDPVSDRLEIYDGQQRLTTLMIMILVCLQREKKDDYVDFRGKYEFCGRPIANSILDMLTTADFSATKIKVSDFSSYSMKNLISVFSQDKYSKMTSDYLLNNVVFDRVEIGSQNEIEQFFMDLNSGVKLKSYELYKAKLVHQINEMLKECTEDQKDILKKWLHKLDNEWLDTFMPFSEFSHPAEEYEIVFIRYCFSMLGTNDSNGAYKDDIQKITAEVLIDCYEIVEAVSKLKLYFSLIEKKEKKETNPPHVVEFAWGRYDECAKIEKYYNFEKRGAYWNLKFNDNEYHLYFIIKNVLLKQGNVRFEELKDDAVVWAYVTSVAWQHDYQNEYIRIIKILLNHIVDINKNAWYECQDKGQYLYYSKYTVSSIPQYYGEHIKPDCEKSNKVLLDDIRKITECFRKKEANWERTLNSKRITEHILGEMNNFSDDDKLKNMLNEIRERYDGDDAKYGQVRRFEDETNGICREQTQKYQYHVSQVDFSWPVIGRSDGGIVSKCWVLLKCRMDVFYEEKKYEPKYLEDLNKIINSFVQEHKELKGFDEEKCFWLLFLESSELRICAYRIQDRTTCSSRTYTKIGGTNDYYWAYKYMQGKVSEV